MNLGLTILLWVISISCSILTLYSCIKTYKNITYEKRQRWLWKQAEENKGRIGEAQKWQCWECGIIMLSNFQTVVHNDSIVAICIKCSSLQKYDHIYNHAIKDCAV